MFQFGWRGLMVGLFITQTVFKGLALIEVTDSELYTLLHLPTCTENGGANGVICNQIEFYPESLACYDELKSLSDCTSLTSCLHTVCKDIQPMCDWNEPESNYCIVADVMQFILDQGGLPSIGLPLEGLPKLLIYLATRYGIEFCDGYLIKCEEHPNGCVALEELCPPNQYYNCYCGLGGALEGIHNLQTKAKLKAR
ncbi:uncharacterized protein LOC144443527 [Glandiceps talaboti]